MQQINFSFEIHPAGGPFQDPGLLVVPSNSKALLLFDCGTLHGLKTRDLLKVRWLFLSHLHIDHLIGFDHLLRLKLFSDLPLTIFGPPGTTEIIGHRLRGYSWNLTSGSKFEVRSIDLDTSNVIQTAKFRCHNGFTPEPLAVHFSEPQTPVITLDQDLTVAWHPVDHGVACHCYRLSRNLLPQFSLETAQSLGLKPGPWVKNLISGQRLEMEVDGVPRSQDWLAERLLRTRNPESLGFLTDTRLTPTLSKELVKFFEDVDLLVSECAYLNCDEEMATQNLHMTTGQVANLAQKAKAKQLAIFHFSKRYQESGTEQHLKEVKTLFPNVSTLER